MKRVLAAIVEAKLAEVRAHRGERARASARSAEPRADVADRLTRAPGEPLRLVAEVKFRSPSAGPLSRALGAGPRAEAYARAGAVMVSVLCDEGFFGGGYRELAAARDALEALEAREPREGRARPLLLCKEFVVDEAQLDWARAAGADAVLVIARVARFEGARAIAPLVRAALDRGLTPIVEVTTPEELDEARSSGARVLGVNARDLDTLEMDAARAERVLAAAAEGHVALHFSGLRTPEDVAHVARTPAHGALVGEALMREDDPSALLRAMVARAG